MQGHTNRARGQGSGMTGLGFRTGGVLGMPHGLPQGVAVSKLRSILSACLLTVKQAYTAQGRNSTTMG